MVATVHDELVWRCRSRHRLPPPDGGGSNREAFVEMFGDEIAAGVVEGKVCPNWAGIRRMKTELRNAALAWLSVDVPPAPYQFKLPDRLY
jgi:hypothetical protein